MATTSFDLPQLREQNAAFNARWKASGRKLTKYRCGHCGQQVECREPRAVDVGNKGCWDSLTTCIHCGGLNMVAVYPGGRTAVSSHTGNP